MLELVCRGQECHDGGAIRRAEATFMSRFPVFSEHLSSPRLFPPSLSYVVVFRVAPFPPDVCENQFSSLCSTVPPPIPSASPPLSLIYGGVDLEPSFHNLISVRGHAASQLPRRTAGWFGLWSCDHATMVTWSPGRPCVPGVAVSADFLIGLEEGRGSSARKRRIGAQ